MEERVLVFDLHIARQFPIGSWPGKERQQLSDAVRLLGGVWLLGAANGFHPLEDILLEGLDALRPHFLHFRGVRDFTCGPGVALEEVPIARLAVDEVKRGGDLDRAHSQRLAHPQLEPVAVIGGDLQEPEQGSQLLRPQVLEVDAEVEACARLQRLDVRVLGIFPALDLLDEFFLRAGFPLVLLDRFDPYLPLVPVELVPTDGRLVRGCAVVRQFRLLIGVMTSPLVLDEIVLEGGRLGGGQDVGDDRLRRLTGLDAFGITEEKPSGAGDGTLAGFPLLNIAEERFGDVVAPSLVVLLRDEIARCCGSLRGTAFQPGGDAKIRGMPKGDDFIPLLHVEDRSALNQAT